MADYTPHNLYVYNQAFSGAVAGLLGQSNSLSNVSGSNTDTIEIAGAWAQEFDTQWGVSTNPDLFEYEQIELFSNDLFQVYEPQPNPEGITPSTYTKSAQSLMILLADAETYLASKGIIPPPSIATGWSFNVTDAPFFADPTGATFSSTAITAAFIYAVANGLAAKFPPGRYTLDFNVNMPSGLIIIGDPNVIIDQQFTGVQDSGFIAQAIADTAGALSLVASPGATAGANIPGTFVVRANGTKPNGSFIFVGDATVEQTFADSAQASTYIVESSTAVGGGDFDITVDRPILGQYPVAGSVTQLTYLPQDIYIYGYGMTFTGNSAEAVSQFVGFGPAQRAYAFDCNFINPATGGLGSNGVALNFDLGSVECGVARINISGGGYPANNLIGVAFQANERSFAEDVNVSECGVGILMVDGFFPEITRCNGYNNDVDFGLLSNGALNDVGVTGAKFVECTGTGSAYSIQSAYGSSNTKVAQCDFSYATSANLWIENQNGPCTGVMISDTTITNGTIGLYISGNGHQVQASNLVIEDTIGNGLWVNGANSRVSVDGFVGKDCATGGNGFTIGMDAASDLTVKRSYLSNTITFGGGGAWIGFAVQGGTWSVDDVIAENVGAAATSFSIVFQCTSVSNIRARNVRTIGTLTNGINTAGVALTFRILEGCDFQSCTTPINFGTGAHTNRVTVTGVASVTPIATAFPDLAGSEIVKATRTTAGGTVAAGDPLILQTTGTGWTTTLGVLNTSGYSEEVS